MEGAEDLLLEDMERKAWRDHPGQAQLDDSKARAYKAAGRLQQAIHWLTSREGRGVRHPDDLCSKAGCLVVGVLQEKHPEMRNPKVGVYSRAFEPHKKVLWTMLIQVTLEHVDRVASQLTGRVGISGVNRV